jgi:hypothetical protein
MDYIHNNFGLGNVPQKYGVELWGSAKPANIQRIQSF